MAKYDVLNEINHLKPARDHGRIAYLSATFEFPWDTQRALELALLRTFAVPRSSRLLVSTGEFVERAQKRYDTTLLISTIGFYGYDSPEGLAAIRRMNEIHGRYKIPNEEYLYVLSTFVLEPLRWNAKWGWRPLHPHEREATYLFWREVGRRMGISDIPASLELAAFSLQYERQHFAYDDANRRLAEATRDLFLTWVLPRPLWPLGAQLFGALLDAPLRRAFGFPAPPLWAEVAVFLGLAVRKRALRLLPPRVRPYLIKTTRTYPAGYRLKDLGPGPRATPHRAETVQSEDFRRTL